MEGCLVCGAPLVYTDRQEDRVCVLCGNTCLSNATCETGHFVCDDCHRGNLLEPFTWLTQSTEKNPLVLFLQIVQSKAVHMHGPEHHILVPAVLLTAYRNNGGSIDLPAALGEAKRRGAQVPGGTCGYWGCCGAAVGAGIALSILTGSAPTKQELWHIPMQTTSNSLLDIATIGGPRCCKRDSLLSIAAAAKVIEHEMGISMPLDVPVCTFSHRNAQCIGNRCPYHPK